jgi:tetratricopeptide (TPR) repeat protein
VLGDAEQAISDAERAIELAERTGNVLALGWTRYPLAYAQDAAGRFEQAAETAERGLAAIREAGLPLSQEPALLSVLATARLRLGLTDDALAAAEEAIAITDDRQLTLPGITVRIALAQVLIASEGVQAADRIEAVLTRAMELVHETDAQAFTPQLHRELAALARLRDDEEAAAREEAEAERIEAEMAGTADEAQRILLELNYVGTLLMGGRERDAVESIPRLLSEAVEAGAIGALVSGSNGGAVSNWAAGSARVAVELADRALELAAGDVEVGGGLMFGNPYALLLSMRGLCLGFTGDLAGSRRDFERALEVAREHDDLEVESYVLTNLSLLGAQVGDIDAAVANGEQALEIGERAGNPLATSVAASALSVAEANAGRVADALERAERTLTMIRENGVPLMYVPMLLAAIAKSKVELGDPEGAVAAAAEGVEIMETRGLTVAALPVPIALAEVMIAAEGAAAAERIEAVLNRAMEVARESGAVIFEPQIQRELEALARLRGEGAADEAQRILLDLGLGATLLISGRESDARESLTRLLHEAIDTGDAGLALTVAAGTLSSTFAAGTASECLELADRALELAAGDIEAGSGLMLRSPYSMVLWMRAMAVGYMGKLAESHREFERALEIAREHDDLESEGFALAARSLVRTESGDVDAAHGDADRALEIAERAGNTAAAVMAAGALSGAEAVAGRFAETLRTAEPALATIRDSGIQRMYEPMLLAAIARAKLGLGKHDVAVAAAAEAVEIMDARGLKVAAMPARIALAQVLIAVEGVAAAERIEAELAKASEVAREIGASIFEPQVQRELAALARLRGEDGMPQPEPTEAQRVGARPTDEILADANYSVIVMHTGREREGFGQLAELSREAHDVGDPGLVLTLAVAVGIGSAFAGSASDGIEVADRALGLAGDDTAAGAGLAFGTPYAMVLSLRAVLAAWKGDADRTEHDFERAIELARSRDDPEVEAYAHHFRALADAMVGDPAKAIDDSARAIELAERAGNPMAYGTARGTLAYAKAISGEFEEALEIAEQGLATVREVGVGIAFEPMLLTAIAKSRLGLDQPEEALAAAEEAVEIAEARRLTLVGLPARIALAQVLTATEGAAAAERIEAVLARAMEIARESHAYAFEPQIQRELESLGRLGQQNAQ